LLHMVTQQWADIPVVMVDTRYLFPETYRFADQLTERLKLNLKVYRAEVSAAWLEARYGKLWEHGVEGIERYNQINKVEPMQRAIRELGVQGWITGLRRQQASSRKEVGVLQKQNGVVKIQPIIDWTDRMIYDYLKKYDLPYHPLWEQGYVSIGDVHTTRPLTADMTEEETRFFGLKRECGIHIGENI
jgi:phosphoadenosine phosphosulfate reductase